MTDEHQKKAFEAIAQQYLTADNSTETANRFLDLLETLRNDPENFWEQYFTSSEDATARKRIEPLIRRHGAENVTLELLRAEFRQ